jgi:undecaprenyl-diphosphatase
VLIGPSATDAALPPGLRRPAAVVALLAVLVLGAFAVRYAGHDAPSHVDSHLDAAADSLAGAQSRLLRRATLFGSPPFVVLAAVGLALGCLLLHRRLLALLAVLGPGLTGVATTLLKPVVGRTIEGGLAYPSGHTAGATAVGLVIALLVVSLTHVGRVAAALIIAAGALLAGGGVGLAMVVSGIHYPTDAVGGFCTAVAVVLGTALLTERIARHRRRAD